MPATPTILSITPGDDATAVSVLGDVRVVVSGPLESATVNETTVRLLNDYGHGIGADVTWDVDTLTITLNPTYALFYGRPHQIEVDGLEDPYGRAVESATATFTSFYNPRLSAVSYEAGEVVGHRVFANDERGRTLEELAYGGPGVDGTWFTEDDAVSSFLERTFDDAAGTSKFSMFFDPGDDGAWFTADDEPFWYEEFTMNSQGDWMRSVEFHGGSDGILGTGDDGVREYIDYFRDAQGHMAQFIRYDDGADETMGTVDDPIVMIGDVTWDESGRAITGQLLGHPGDDGAWHTEDDFVFHYEEGTFGGNVLRVVTYLAPFGPDGIRGTEDDVPDSYDDDTYTLDRQLLSSTSYEAPGADSEWFTSDDVRSYGSAYGHDADGNTTTRTYTTGPGPDGLWDTSDDEYTEYTYAAF